MRPRAQLAPRSWLRLPRRTARLRLTLLYGGLFLACGAVLLAITYLLSDQAINRGQMSRVPVSSGAPNGVPVHVHPAEPAAGSAAAMSLATTDRAVTRELAAQRASDLHHLLVNSGIALAIVVLIAVLLGWYVAGRVLQPVRTITATARAISVSNLSERLALENADEEFRQLGDTLDDLFGRLEAAFKAQQRFVANASHELRTPLAWEQMLLQVALADPNASNVALRESCEKALAASKQQQGLVEALLTLATSERRLDHHEPIDLADLADAVVLDAGRQAEKQAIELTVTFQPAPTAGQPALVERLIANLIDNAIRYNTPRGHVHVETGTTADSRARLLVTNSGPEVQPAQVGRLFEPFQRLKAGRSNGDTNGYGLGLSIVQAIATAHQARLTAHPRNNGGLEIEVTFPARHCSSRPASNAHREATSETQTGHHRPTLGNRRSSD